MCLIIDRPAGIGVPKTLLERGLALNSDGWGIMYAEDGRIRVVKGMLPDQFHIAWHKVGHRAATIHFRWATHGRKNVSNCHPYLIGNREYAVVHNGIIPFAPETKPDRSDTWHFCAYVLWPLLNTYPDLFGTDALRSILADLVGSSNKLVILRRDGVKMVINEREGTEHEGLWLSNRQAIYPRSTSAWADDWFRNDRGEWETDTLYQYGKTYKAWKSLPAPDPLPVELIEPTDGQLQAIETRPVIRPDLDNDPWPEPNRGHIEPREDVHYRTTLEDYRGMTSAEIAYSVETDPDSVTDAICDYLGYRDHY